MELLTCASCGRAFPSALPLERHRLRCKFRPRTRKKACVECARSKTRCDHGQPACSRCQAHSLLCTYPHPHPPETQAAAGGVVAWPLPAADQPLPLPLPPTGFGLQEDAAGGILGWPRVDNDGTGGDGWDGDLSLLLTPTAVPDTGCWPDEPQPTLSNPPTTAPANPGDAFRSLSACLSERSWTTTEQGIALVDREWTKYIDALLFDVGGHGYSDSDRPLPPPPPFVHWRDWEPSRRSEPLAGAAIVAQLTAVPPPRAPQLVGVLVDLLEAQLTRLTLKIGKGTYPEDVAALHAMMFSSAVREYRAGPLPSASAQLIDRTTVRNMQHIFGRRHSALTPGTNLQPSDWDEWILEESVRRCFFAAHALDYVIHARQGILSMVLCSLFPEAPLPCPAVVWEAPTAEAWAVEYRRWEESWNHQSQPQPLKARHVICWVRGRETGYEDRLADWFRSANTGLEDLVFVCARSQGTLPGAESLL